MNKKIIFGGILSLLSVVAANVASAQTNSTQEQSQEQLQSEESDSSEEEYSESPERVTIAGENTNSRNTDASDDSGTERQESNTKIYIYSGKHDGNNIVNPDPKTR
ncbi:MAG: hypothetical protein LC117_01510 [Bacteroidia bacterium]|nr:hypothetical protein [Bacteroidia bacterium]MCZ2276591.1 hypothetical protein [Bacteroidia bacterium]